MPILRFLFALVMQLISAAAAIAGMVGAYGSGKLPGLMRFCFFLAFAYLWLLAGAGILPHLALDHSPAGLAVYMLWGSSGIAPYCIALFGAENQTRSRRTAAAAGIFAVLLFCGMLTVMIHYACAGKTVLSADCCRDTICRVMIFPAVLFFMPTFFLTALILGTMRNGAAGFIGNLILPVLAPGGGFILFAVGLSQLSRLHAGKSGSVGILFVAAAVWLVLLFAPYAVMMLRGRREKDECRFYNGAAGLAFSAFFLAGLWLLSRIGAGV